MAGRMGNKLRTIQNLEIIKSDPENNLIFVKGSVPGSKNSFVLIQKNAKRISRVTTVEKIKKEQVQSSVTAVITKKQTKAPEKKETTKVKVEKKEVKK